MKDQIIRIMEDIDFENSCGRTVSYPDIADKIMALFPERGKEMKCECGREGFKQIPLEATPKEFNKAGE